ncbi:NAD(P)-dependent oxidoreductase [Nonomuraea sediminis]|uniref:NAD(P)-dependent oxidoreductase n=1 Tax=Nonomuraea sediminis TaxID=2835864 RepID=UPI001BDBF89F|nr:NAD(P)-binding domain-containing protein [Nonomuraea sediminis]
MTDVTVIGLGPMGSKMAETFLAAGHRVSVWNRTRSKADPLLAKGAEWADRPASDLVVISQIDYQAMYDSLGEQRLDGKVLVNLSSDTPNRLREAADWVASRGGVLVTAGIMTPPPGIGLPGAYTYYSGPRAALDRFADTLAALTEVRYVGEDPGLAMSYYQASLLMFWSSLAAHMHATALVGAAGAKPGEFLPFAQHLVGGLAVEGPMGYLKILTENFESGEYPGGENSLHMQVAGLGHAVHALEDEGVDASWPKALLRLFERAEAAGHGQDGVGSLYEVLT